MANINESEQPSRAIGMLSDVVSQAQQKIEVRDSVGDNSIALTNQLRQLEGILGLSLFDLQPEHPKVVTATLWREYVSKLSPHLTFPTSGEGINQAGSIMPTFDAITDSGVWHIELSIRSVDDRYYKETQRRPISAEEFINDLTEHIDRTINKGGSKEDVPEKQNAQLIEAKRKVEIMTNALKT